MTGPYEVDVQAKKGLVCGVRRPHPANGRSIYLTLVSVDAETALDPRFWRAMQEMVVRARKALGELKKMRRKQ